MRAIVYRVTGDPGVLTLVERPEPEEAKTKRRSRGQDEADRAVV